MKRAAVLIAVVAWSSSCTLGSVGAWKPAAAPLDAIAASSDVVPLPDGRVAVLGGVALETGEPIGRTLSYDSRLDRWRSATPIPEPRFDDTVAVLRDGSVLVTGGYGQSPQGSPPALSTTYVYDPNADVWRRVGDLPAPISGGAAIELSDGRIMLVGGSIPLAQPVYLEQGGVQVAQDTGRAEIFDPSSGSWSESGSLLRVQSGAAYAPLRGGGALVAGGCARADNGSSLTALDSTEVFNSTQGAWRLSMPMPEPRCGARAVPLLDGRVLIVGGFAQSGVSLDDAVTFDPRSDSWSTAGRVASSGVPIPINGLPNPITTTLEDGRVLAPVVQVHQQRGGLTTLWVGGDVYDPSSNSWSPVTTVPAVASIRFGLPQALGAAPLPGNRALVLLENNALIFDASASPPATTVLDSSSLTAILVAIAAALLLMIAVVYAAGRRRT